MVTVSSPRKTRLTTTRLLVIAAIVIVSGLIAIAHYGSLESYIPSDILLNLVEQEDQETVPREHVITESLLENVRQQKLRQQQQDTATTFMKKSTNSKPLNIVLFYPDDMRHDSMSCAGTPVIKTPFLDGLAKRGIRFIQNRVTTSICWISRATLITGQYLRRHQSGILRFPLFYDKWNETAWPHFLREFAGYHVGHIGKWQYWYFERLYSRYDWFRMHEGEHWYLRAKSPHKRRSRDTYIHAADMAAWDAIDFLNERPKDKPFVLTVAFYPPKAIGWGDYDQYNPKNSTLEEYYANETIPPPAGGDPNEAFKKLPPFFNERRDEGRTRYDVRFGTEERYQHNMKDYYAMITEMDAACKLVYDELEKQGLVDETMVIFTTDNGYYLGEHGLGGKWYPHEESIRVPLIIQDPRMPKDKIGTTDDSFTLNIDLAETIMGAAGLPPGPLMQGRDIADLYLKDNNNKEPWRQEFFYDHVIPGHEYIPNSTALVRKDFKYIQWTDHDMEQLFDLESDPHEVNDLAKDPKYEKILAEMRQRHGELLQQAY